MKDQLEAMRGADPHANSAVDVQARTPAKRSALRKIAAAAILAAGFCWVVFLFAITLTDSDVAGRDYIQYWAAGRQVLHHANPYDADAILKLEQSAGPGRTEAELSGSPPLVLLLAAPIAVFSARVGLIVWFAVLFASLCASLAMLWLLYGSPNSLLYLFGFLFAPVLACLQCGQISILFLLCILGFLYFLDSRPSLAGVLLVPLTLKPHLFLPFAVALMFWAGSRRSWRLLTGFTAALALCLAAVFYLDPHAWAQYLQMMRMQRLSDEFVPTVSNAMQRFLSPGTTWLRYLPDAAACVWAGWYVYTRRNRWKWTDQGWVVLLVSCLCAPYGFLFDESVLLPAVLTGVLRARRSGRSLWPIAIAAAAALIECFRMVRVTSLFYLWTAPAWLLWYLYATRAYQPTDKRRWKLAPPSTEAFASPPSANRFEHEEFSLGAYLFGFSRSRSTDSTKEACLLPSRYCSNRARPCSLYTAVHSEQP